MGFEFKPPVTRQPSRPISAEAARRSRRTTRSKGQTGHARIHTASRVARQASLSAAATAHWPLVGADVAAAFLQGKPQQRELRVRLPADAARMLGVASYPYMKLDKPMYHQVDATCERSREARRKMQLVSLTQHPLDSGVQADFTTNWWRTAVGIERTANG